MGPGIILLASVVGSGDLIAITTLGAQAGYVALWVILLRCFIKPAIEVEMGATPSPQAKPAWKAPTDSRAPAGE